MADLTTTPTTVSFRDEGFLDAGITAAATSITVGSIFKWPNGVKTEQGFDSTAGFAVLELGGRFERISFGSASVSSNVTTLSDVRRGLSQTATSASFTAGTGLAWPKGTKITVSNDPTFFQNSAYLDVQNTFSDRIGFSGTTHSGLRLISLTTAERDALTAANGDIIYNETTGAINSYEGGAWGTSTSNTVDDASTTAAGKVEVATTAEIRAETATGGSGAPAVITADATAVLKDDRIVLKDATELTISSGAVTVTQPYHTIDTESDASGDALATITAAVGAGEVIYVRMANSARVINFMDGDGNLVIPGGDYTLADPDEILCFVQDGTNWRLVGPRGAVVGEMKIWTTDTAPTGWLLCDGTAYNASTSAQYQPLFDRIANAFGGSDNTDFQVPDMRGRFPLGQDDMGGASANRVTAAAADTVGSSGGSETTDGHTHTIDPDNAAINTGGGGSNYYGFDDNGTQPTSSSTDGCVNPFLTLNYIIRY